MEDNRFTVLCWVLLNNKLNQLYTFIYLPPPSCASLPHSPPPRGSSQSARLDSCAVQQPPASCLVYTRWCVYVSAALSLPHPVLHLPCPQAHSLRLCLYSCPANRFISTVFLDSMYMHWYVIFIFLTYFTLYNRLWVHPPHYNWINFVPFYVWVVFHRI